jgi:hypothetical protein
LRAADKTVSDAFTHPKFYKARFPHITLLGPTNDELKLRNNFNYFYVSRNTKRKTATVRQYENKQQEKNSGVLVRQRTIPTERPPLVGEVNANFSR